MLHVLVADDEAPAREELAFLLRSDPRVSQVRTAGSGAETLKLLESEPVDALFLDIKMPGLDGMDVARLVARFRVQPQLVFVTAYEEHAVEAFELEALDFLRKPVRRERLAEAVRRVVVAREGGDAEDIEDATSIPVELGGVTRFVPRSEVRYVEAHGDYARLHTAEGSHLVRVPLATLEEQWADAGFLRIHRSHLVSLAHIDEVHVAEGRCTVRIGATVLAVSRRHTRELRDTLVRRARPGGEPR